MKKYTFKKEERLSKKTLIDSLFSREHTQKFKEYPFILLAKDISLLQESVPVQVMFSVSKRNIKHAVKRNLVKRRAKEAYRLHKHDLINHFEAKNKKYILCFVFLNKKPIPYKEMEQKIIVLLKRLKNSCA